MYFRKIKSGKWMFEIAKVGHQRFAETFKDIRIGKKRAGLEFIMIMEMKKSWKVIGALKTFKTICNQCSKYYWPWNLQY